MFITVCCRPRMDYCLQFSDTSSYFRNSSLLIDWCFILTFQLLTLLVFISIGAKLCSLSIPLLNSRIRLFTHPQALQTWIRIQFERWKIRKQPHHFSKNEWKFHENMGKYVKVKERLMSKRILRRLFHLFSCLILLFTIIIIYYICCFLNYG